MEVIPNKPFYALIGNFLPRLIGYPEKNACGNSIYSGHPYLVPVRQHIKISKMEVARMAIGREIRKSSNPNPIGTVRVI